MMITRITSWPDDGKIEWPDDHEACSRCGESLGPRKTGRDEDGLFYHYNGCPEETTT